MKKLLSLWFCIFWVTLSFAQNNPLWLRYPAISPDGSSIVFGYKGDLYKVSSKGGEAVPLTVSDAHDEMPVWSRDGKSIAFASNRAGNFDVYVISANGGTPLRLTYNSSNDFPYDFSPDNKSVIFGSARNIQASNVRFYSPRLFQNLYSVPITGGKAMLISGAGMENAHYNSKGNQIVFQDRKGYEDPWRKHHTSAVTRDIWIVNLKNNQYQKVSDYIGEDREPIWSNDDQSIYYLSEKNGSQNVYIHSLSSKKEAQLTQFKNNPVRHLSSSKDNTLCFTYDGEIYTLVSGGTPQKVSMQIRNDGGLQVEKNTQQSDISEFKVSPNGKEIAYVTRGEIFVTNIDGKQTKRITNTPQQERMVEWSPDGRTLIYAAERNDNWDIYTSTIVRKEEPYFYASTTLKEEPFIFTNAEEFQPKYSPDGKEVAYVENRNILKVYNIASKKSRTLLPEGHNHSYSDGDWDFQWSPDNKWILADDQQDYFGSSNTALIKADGSGSILHPINSGFGEGAAKWGLNGKMMTWVSSREGRKSLANQGSTELDVYGVFFDQDLYDRYKMNKEDFDLLKEEEGKQKKDDKKIDSLKSMVNKEKLDTKKAWEPDLKGLEDRQVKMTINSSTISDYVLDSTRSKLYYLASFEKGFDLWETELRTKSTKILAKLGGSPSGIEMSKDGKYVYVSNNNTLIKIEIASGKVSPIASNSEMVWNPAAERAYIFDHVWRQVKEKFYDPKLHGVDWNMYKTTYAKFLPYINNNYDFQELLSELLGELNGSHTGGRYNDYNPDGDATAALGLLYDETYTGNGLKITEVITGGPLDKSISKVKAGNVITKINGAEITNDFDWSKLLNRTAGKNTLLTLYDPNSKTTFEESMKPISFGAEAGLMYKRWVKTMSDMVDKLSGGKVGYVHVQGMNDGSFRTTYDQVLGKNKEKDALIVDTRFNGGGWLHDDLSTFLSGKTYLQFSPQGNLLKGGEPLGRWQKPSCVLMSESNYSDAFIFPYVYKQLGIGKLIGMPVAGTGTAVWWETQIDPTIVFGIPMVGTIGKEGRTTENLQVEPDIRVPLPYEDLLNGRDTQIEAAVKEMLKEIGMK
jgi:Tol biopolymer transport system component/C-terminal processing protease CtpA/Prc